MSTLLCAGVGSLNQRVAKLWLQQPSADVLGLRLSASDSRLGFKQISVNLSQSTWPDLGADVVVVALSARERTIEGYRLAYVEPIKRLSESLSTWSKLPKRIIVVSSSRVYGASDGEVIDDTLTPEPADEFGEQLRLMELLVADLPIESVVVRLSGIYGPGRDWLKRQALAATESSQTENNWTNRIHIDDAAQVILFLLQQQTVHSSYIASDNQPVPLLDIYNYFREREGLPHLDIELPVLGGKQLQPTRLKAAGFHWQYPTAFSGGYF